MYSEVKIINNVISLPYSTSFSHVNHLDIIIIYAS